MYSFDDLIISINVFIMSDVGSWETWPGSTQILPGISWSVNRTLLAEGMKKEEDYSDGIWLASPGTDHKGWGNVLQKSLTVHICISKMFNVVPR